MLCCYEFICNVSLPIYVSTYLFVVIYLFQPPKVKCLTRLWHPNINVDGDICLSLLRQTSIDEHGWAPTRRLKDVVWGLNSLFTVCVRFIKVTTILIMMISADVSICNTVLFSKNQAITTMEKLSFFFFAIITIEVLVVFLFFYILQVSI